MKGMVKFYNKEKGFGFVISEENEEFYFNHSVIPFGKIPNSGDLIEFEIKQNSKNDKKAEVKSMEFLGQSVENSQKNSHITCPHCQKDIIPRALTYQGTIMKTYCPFCSKTIQEFGVSKFYKIFAICLVIFVLLILFSAWFGPFLRTVVK